MATVRNRQHRDFVQLRSYLKVLSTSAALQHITRTVLTIIILQNLVVDGRGHADSLTREVGVVVESFSHRHSCRRLAVTCQQAEHVVLSAMSAVRQRDIR